MTSSILNGPAFTHAALQASDEQAFHLLLSTMTKPGVTLEGFVYEDVTQDADDPTKATLTARIIPTKSPISQWGYQDSINLQYRRVALPAVFDRYGQSVRTDLPTTVQEVMKAYFSAAGLHDRSEQFEDLPIESLGIVTVAVLPRQFLLYGESTLDIKPRQRILADVLTVTQLKGFRDTSDFDYSELTTLISQLTDLNAERLPYPLQSEWLVLGTPEAISDYAQDNTQLTITAFGDGFYIGQQTLVYSRLNFGWYTGGTQFYLEGPVIPTIEYILDQISVQTGFPLTVNDVLHQTFNEVPEGEVQTLSLTFKPENLRYAGELTVDYKVV